MMTKTRYFKHNEHAQDAPELTALRIALGWSGYGLYWGVYEKLAATGGRYALGRLTELAYNLRADVDELTRVVRDFGLFETDGVYFWSPELVDNLEQIERVSTARRTAARKRWTDPRPHPGGPGTPGGIPHPADTADETGVTAHGDTPAPAVATGATGAPAAEAAPVSAPAARTAPDTPPPAPDAPDASEPPAAADDQAATPTLDQVRRYVKAAGMAVDPRRFVDYYTARGWILPGGAAVRDWRALLRSWVKTERPAGNCGGAPHKTDAAMIREAEQRRAKAEAEAATAGAPVTPAEWRRRRGLDCDSVLAAILPATAPQMAAAV